MEILISPRKKDRTPYSAPRALAASRPNADPFQDLGGPAKLRDGDPLSPLDLLEKELSPDLVQVSGGIFHFEGDEADVRVVEEVDRRGDDRVLRAGAG